MSAGNNLNYFLTKLYAMDKELGGNSKLEDDGKKKSEFDHIRTRLMEIFHRIRISQDERDSREEKRGRSIEVVKMGVEIKNDLEESDSLLSSIKDILKRQKKKGKLSSEQLENSEKMYQNLLRQYEDFLARERGEDVEMRPVAPAFTDLKDDLLNNGNSRRRNNGDVRIEANEQEEEAMNQFRKNDDEMELKLKDINIGLEDWKANAKAVGNQIDARDMAMNKVEKQVDKTDSQLKTTNQRLKDVLKKYRAPSRLCLDITLVMLFIGLLAVIINMVK